MTCILSGIESLVQHIFQLQENPEAYRPEACPHCGKKDIWRHGSYERKASRNKDGPSNPIPIQRFYCPNPQCQKTCSTLPECIPPRRWYLWAVQQLAFNLLLAGTSVRKGAQAVNLSRKTVARWWVRLKEQYFIHASVLRGLYPAFGQHQNFTEFWRAWFLSHSLSFAMFKISQAQIDIP